MPTSSKNLLACCLILNTRKTVMRHLRYFHYMDAVARKGSIRAAAEKLHITPSALDRRVQDIEDELEAPLFQRHARGMHLTPAGEIFIAYVRRHLADTARVESQIQGLKALRKGHVSVIASQALGLQFLPQRVVGFRELFPGISFSLTIGDRDEALKALASYEADLALVVSPRSLAEIEPLAIVEQPILALMDREHPLASADELRLSDCLQYPLVIPDAELGTGEVLNRALQKRNVEPNLAARTNSFELMRALLTETDSIGFQVAIGIAEPQGNNRLVAIPVVSRDLAPIPIVCAQLKGRHLSVAAARFADDLNRQLVAQT